MYRFHTILHPTDFSEHSENALQIASSLARDYAARLVIFHAAHPIPAFYGNEALPLDPEVIYRETRQQLFALAIPGGNVRAERQMEQGEPIPTILRVAREIEADLIVMGTHGRTGLNRFVMGSVAEQIVRKATCPVLTVTGQSRVPQAEESTPVGTAAPPNDVGAKDVSGKMNTDDAPFAEPPEWPIPAKF